MSGPKIKEHKCGKCGEAMKYFGIRKSGNTEYAVWKCERCKAEELRCMGVSDD